MFAVSFLLHHFSLAYHSENVKVSAFSFFLERVNYGRGMCQASWYHRANFLLFAKLARKGVDKALKVWDITSAPQNGNVNAESTFTTEEA
jgi:hypothetical protein